MLLHCLEGGCDSSSHSGVYIQRREERKMPFHNLHSNLKWTAALLWPGVVVRLHAANCYIIE